MPRYWNIDTGHGNQLAAGLAPEIHARRVAQEKANALSESVWLYDPRDIDDEGEVQSEEIHPVKKTEAQLAKEVKEILGDPRTPRRSLAHSPVRRRLDPKTEIEGRAISGQRLQGQDVARLSRDRKIMRLRHVWPEGTDGRVWAGVRRAFMAWAHEIADQTGKPVEIYAKEGFRGWNEITWSFRVDLRPKIGQMTKLIKSSPLR
jgi:hypothetical protein